MAVLLLCVSADAALVSTPQANLLQADSDRYVNQILPQILTNWNMAVFMENAHSSVWQRITERQLEATFFAYRKLGDLQQYASASGTVILSQTPDGGTVVSGSYQARATFLNGDATIELVTIKDGRTWKCASLLVYSDALYASRPPPADPMAQMREDLGAQPVEERTRLENEILQLDELAIRHRVSEVIALAGIREENGDKDRAADLYEAALRGQSADLDIQIKLAEIHASLGRTREAVERAQTVYRLAESRALFDRARSLLSAAEACPPAPELREEGMATNVEFVLVPLGDVSGQLVLELQAELQKEMKIRFSVMDGALPLPPAARTAADQYRAHVFSMMTQEVTRLQFDDLLESAGIRQVPAAFSAEQQQELVEAYLDMLGPQGTAIRQNYAATVEMLSTQRQYHATAVMDRLGERFLTGAVERVKGYIGVTEEDIFGEGANFLFGSASGDCGVVSAARFRAIQGFEPESRPRLVRRLKKQAMSTAGFILGIPRCADPSCARAFPASVAEHDAKSEHLCPECLARLEAYKDSPHSAFAAAPHINRAIEHDKAADRQRALLELRRAVQLCGTNATTWLHLGRLLFETGDPSGAEQASVKASELTGGGLEAQLQLSLIYSSQGRLQESIRMLDLLLESHPSNDEVIAERARLADAAGDVALSRKLLSTAMQLGPTNPAVFSLAGAIQYNQGDYPAALASGRRALSLDSNNTSAIYVIGMALGNSGQPQQAYPYLARVLGVFPREAPLWRMYGVSCSSVGKMDDALLAFRKAVELDPANADIVSDLGFTYFLQGRHQDALACYDRALALNPGLGLAHYNKAMVYQAMGEAGKALDSLNRARAAGYPGSPHFQAEVERAARQATPAPGP